MKQHLRDYIKVFENHIDHKLCDDIISELQGSDWQKHVSYNNIDDEYVSVSGDLELDVVKDFGETSKRIYQKMGEGFNKYIQSFRFPFFQGISQHSPQRYNRYNKDTLMYLHVDHIHTLFDGTRRGIPTLTGLVMLNDDYEGGEFIMWENTKIELNKGSMIVFPSIFMYPHRVDSIKSGVRYSCVSWGF